MTTEQKIIRAKVGLLELAKQLGNVMSYFTFSPSPLVASGTRGPLKHLVEDRDRYGNIRIGTNIHANNFYFARV